MLLGRLESTKVGPAENRTGETASNTIRNFIMQRAQSLLIGGMNVNETAEHLGFDYPQHFTRQFKNHFGITPTQFLKQHD